MSANTSISSSTGLERDAQRAMGDHRVAPSEIAMGVVIGRASEYFDFFVFGIACVLVFPKVFFPFVDARTGTLYAFGIFALAFVARPFGTALFMAIDRRHGRGVKLTTALFLLGGSTAAISFLPRYESIGLTSVYLLAALRIMQGLALGGAWDGLASLLALNAPRERRGWYAMIPQLGAPIGFMVASALFSFFIVNLSPEDFIDWGWRFPFYCAFTINVVALFARLRLVATDEFARMMDSDRLQPVPVLELFRNHLKEVLLGAFVPLAAFALFHLVTIFPIAWLALINSDRSPGEFLMVQFSGAIICAGAVAASGLIADQIGRRACLILSSSLIGLFALGSIMAPLLFGRERHRPDHLRDYRLHAAGLGLRPVLRRRHRPPRQALPLHRRGADLGFLVAVRRGLRAPGRPLPVGQFGLAVVGVYLLSGAVCSLAALFIDRSELRQM